MVRRTLLVLAATAVAALAVPTSALAGAGCHGTAPTSGEGDTVEMKDACFRPSTLQVDPGDTVTFVNLDEATHNVSAMGWGHFEDMVQGDAFTATFSKEGVYPFACQYHLGMTGAIVVGDGKGAGNGGTVTVASYRPEESAQAVATERPADLGSSSAGWVAAGGIGLAAGLGAGLAIRRRRANST